MSAGVIQHPSRDGWFIDVASGLPFIGAPEPRPVITPLHIMSAQRQWFDVVVRKTWSWPRVCLELFAALPLEEYGWEPETTKATHIGNEKNLYPIWRVSRE
jgi:hypothetical protein